MSAPMKPGTKAIIINSSMIAALIYKYWTGTPFFIIAIAAIFLFVFANLLMMFAAKKRISTTD